MTVSWTATPKQFEEVIGAVLPHADVDSYAPVLSCVRIEITAGRLTAVATNRFTVGISWADFADWNEDGAVGGAVAACLYATDLRRVFAFLRPYRKEKAKWTLDATGLSVTVAGGTSLTVRTVDVEFVKWRPLLQDMSGVNAGGSIPFVQVNPKLIGHLLASAKVLGEEAGRMRWHFGPEPIRPIFVTIGERFIGVLMPQKPEENVVLDLSPIGIEQRAAVTA